MKTLWRETKDLWSDMPRAEKIWLIGGVILTGIGSAVIVYDVVAIVGYATGVTP